MSGCTYGDPCVTHAPSLHPFLPILATASGQRRFAISRSNAESDTDEDDELFVHTTDNTVKLWAAQADISTPGHHLEG